MSLFSGHCAALFTNTFSHPCMYLFPVVSRESVWSIHAVTSRTHTASVDVGPANPFLFCLNQRFLSLFRRLNSQTLWFSLRKELLAIVLNYYIKQTCTYKTNAKCHMRWFSEIIFSRVSVDVCMLLVHSFLEAMW